MDVETEKIIGVEALIRWNHPKYGLIYPDEFMEFAESTGLIIKIGEWLIQEAITQLHKWNEKYDKRLRISINLSPTQFLYSDLLQQLQMNIQQVWQA